jgi:hypothetical protein
MERREQIIKYLERKDLKKMEWLQKWRRRRDKGEGGGLAVGWEAFFSGGCFRQD